MRSWSQRSAPGEDVDAFASRIREVDDAFAERCKATAKVSADDAPPDFTRVEFDRVFF